MVYFFKKENIIKLMFCGGSISIVLVYKWHMIEVHAGENVCGHLRAPE